MCLHGEIMQTEGRNFFGKGKFQFSHKIFYWIQVMSLKLEFALLFIYVNCFKTKGLQGNKTSHQYDLVGLDILVLFNFKNWHDYIYTKFNKRKNSLSSYLFWLLFIL